MTQLKWKHIEKVIDFLDDDLAKIDQGNLPTYGVRKKDVKRARIAWGLAADCKTFIDFHPWTDRYRDDPGDAIVLAGILVHKLSTMPHIVAQLPASMQELIGGLFIAEEPQEGALPYVFVPHAFVSDEDVPAQDTNATKACGGSSPCSDCLDCSEVDTLEEVVRRIVRVGGEVHCNVNLNANLDGAL